MDVRDLNREQLTELKRRYLIMLSEQGEEGVSYGELAEADTIVPDDIVFRDWEGVDFVEEDFFC